MKAQMTLQMITNEILLADSAEEGLQSYGLSHQQEIA